MGVILPSHLGTYRETGAACGCGRAGDRGMGHGAILPSTEDQGQHVGGTSDLSQRQHHLRFP